MRNPHAQVERTGHAAPCGTKRRGRSLLRLVGATCLFVCAVAVQPAAYAQPPAEPPNPFPDLTYYDELDAGMFFVPGHDGVWFVSATGQNCGIWGWGSFGCAGHIPGAPPGTTHIGWIDGDRAVHYDWSVGVRFPGTKAVQQIPPDHFVTWEGTTCAVTKDRRTYCERGPLRFVIEPTRTWLSAPWTDLSWVTLGPSPSGPPPPR